MYALDLVQDLVRDLARDPIAWRAGGGGISISGNVMGFLATGIGQIRIRLRMISAVADLTVDEMHYPLTNEFFGFQRTATGGQYVVDDGTSTATVDYDWSAGETVTVVVVGDGETMTVGVVA